MRVEMEMGRVVESRVEMGRTRCHVEGMEELRMQLARVVVMECGETASTNVRYVIRVSIAGTLHTYRGEEATRFAKRRSP